MIAITFIKNILKYAAIILAAFSFLHAQDFHLRFGADILLSEKKHLIEGKKLGVVTNKSAILSNKLYLIDELMSDPALHVEAFFALEHGIKLDKAAGESIRGTDEDEVKIYSLYGETKKPTSEMLQDIDLIVFDVQDAGVRCFTYISSLYYILQACGENNVPVLVLDRPNPLGGEKIGGPILESEFKSFVGIAEVPFIHGMTIGELSLLFNDWINTPADLNVIKMEGWKRDTFYDEYNITWINPSPNLIDFEIALIYPATVFFEGTNISEGRGTYTPFSVIGAPFIDAAELHEEIIKLELPGIESREIDFVPYPIEGKVTAPKYGGERCFGVQLKVVNRESYDPMFTAVSLIKLIHDLYPEKFIMKDFTDLLWGTDKVRKAILSDASPQKIIATWQKELGEFNKERTKYLLYPNGD